MNNILIKPVDASSPLIRSVVKLHLQVLDDEFITRFGSRFLRHYYQGFADSPYAVVFIAVQSNEVAGDEVVGALLGTLDVPRHYQFFTKNYGMKLAIDIALTCLLHPSTGRMLIRTRLKRYVAGVMRQFRRRTSSHSVANPKADVASGASADHIANPTAEPTRGLQELNSPSEEAGPKPSLQAMLEPKVADITHLFVSHEIQSNGVGSKLVSAYEERARAFGVHRVDLVTAPESAGGAGLFYEKLGWQVKGEQVSRSDEKFVLYEKWLLTGQNLQESP